MATGWETLGQVLGGTDRETAYQEGLYKGAQTQDALAKAKMRRDEAQARLQLKGALEEFGFDGPQAALADLIMRSGTGSDFSAFQTGRAKEQEMGFRSNIADMDVPLAEAQRSAMAIHGQPVDPYQTVGTGLFADIFAPDEGVQVSPLTPVNEANIGALGELAFQREQAGLLSEDKRLNPEKYRNPRAANKTDTLREEMTSIVDEMNQMPPETSIPVSSPRGEPLAFEKATGLGGAVREGVSIVGDLFGQEWQQEAATASQALDNVAARTRAVVQSTVPGRPSNYLLELLGVYVTEPYSLLRGNQRAKLRLEQTVNYLESDVARIETMMKSGIPKTPTQTQKLEESWHMLRNLAADYRILLDNYQLEGDGGELAEEVTRPGLPPGWTVERIE